VARDELVEALTLMHERHVAPESHLSSLPLYPTDDLM
jgi:hypothetical protein